MHIKDEPVELRDGIPISIKIYKCTQETPHYHKSMMEIVFCLKGSVSLTKAGEEIALKQGQIAVIDAEDIHSVSASKDNTIASFYFDLNSPLFNIRDRAYLAFICHQNIGYKSNEPHINNIRQLLLSILSFYLIADGDNSNNETIVALAVNVMKQIYEYLSLFTWSNGSEGRSEEDQIRLERIFSYIYTHYNEKITISQLSENEDISFRQMSDFFKKTSFLGFKNLKTYIRVYKAEIMLLTTHSKVADISEKCGFCDPKFFYKGFEKWYGRTPAGHRRWYEEYAKHAVPNVLLQSKSELELLREQLLILQAGIPANMFGITAA